MSLAMKFSIISIFPDLIKQALSCGVLARGIKNNKLQVQTINLRDFSEGKYQSLDDKVYGGVDGMLLKPEPVAKALHSLGIKNKNSDHSCKSKVVYLSPQGALWTNSKAKAWAQKDQDLILICGRYAGLDQRIIDLYVDEEVSIGDYILSGGELAALVIVDSISRFIPGVLGHQDSASQDSLNNYLLEAPQFTRPAIFESMLVPKVLTNGDHKKIKKYNTDCSISNTKTKRPDLYKKYLELKKQSDN